MTNSRMSRRRALGLGVAIAIVALATVVGVVIYRGTLGYWDRLEAAATVIGTPSGMKKLFEVREGSTLCFFSCEDAQLIVAFRTRLSRDEACESARAKIDDHFEITPLDFESDPTCMFLARLPSVGGTARLTVAVLTPSQWLAGMDYDSRLERVPELARDESVVTIGMVAGLD